MSRLRLRWEEGKTLGSAREWAMEPRARQRKGAGFRKSGLSILLCTWEGGRESSGTQGLVLYTALFPFWGWSLLFKREEKIFRGAKDSQGCRQRIRATATGEMQSSHAGCVCVSMCCACMCVCTYVRMMQVKAPGSIYSFQGTTTTTQ